MDKDDKIEKEKTTWIIILIVSVILTLSSGFILKKFFSKTSRLRKFEKIRDRNIRIYNEIESRMHLYSKIQLNTSEHPDDEIAIRIKADDLGLNIEEFKKVHNEAVELYKEVCFSQNLQEINQILNERAEEISEEFKNLNREFKSNEIEKQFDKVMLKISDISDRYSRLELQYKVLIENIRKNNEKISNFDFESYRGLNSRIEGLKLYFNFYERMDFE